MNSVNITIYFNQYAQNKRSVDDIMCIFEQIKANERSTFYCFLFELILQSKCTIDDIDEAIRNANIKPTLNCCVIARRGITYGNIKKMEKLPDVYQTIIFLLNLFKIGYNRRKCENSAIHKWWYHAL